MPRTKRLNEKMTRFLEDSGYGDPSEVVVLTDGALDLAGVANDPPYDSGRTSGGCYDASIKLSRPWHMGDSRTVDQRSNCGISSSASAITFGPENSVAWQQFAAKPAHLLDLREKRDPAVSSELKK